MKHYPWITLVTAIFLLHTPEAFALPACTAQNIGVVFGCSANGRPGHRSCLEPGTLSPCIPTVNPPPPVTGSVIGKYIILTVIYAPPGTDGGKSTSQVSYESDSTTGTTTTNSSSFKQDYAVSAEVDCGTATVSCGGVGVFSGGASFEYTQNKTHTDSLDITKTTSSKVQVNGPAADSIDHGLDEIWLFLRPKYDVTIYGTDLVKWSLAADQSGGVLQYLYVEQLRDPSKISAGLLQDLQAAGITQQDYQVILSADPLALCAQRTVEENKRVIIQSVSAACVTPTPTAPRYVPANINLPYNPPPDANEPVPLQTVAIDNSSIAKSTDSFQYDYKLGVTASGGISFLDIFKATLKTDDSWTWTDVNTTEAETGSEQKMSVALGGPAFGYSGPANMDIYYDTLYKTFAFVPNELTADSLHGVVLNSAEKPAAWQLVTATVNGITYRTYTNARGEYHFSGKFTGPVVVKTGTATAQQLPNLDSSKSFDFRLK
jgi:hypothetical protein